MRFWLGGYSADMNGSATGIGILHAGSPDDTLAGGPLSFTGNAVATGGSPSWLTAHPFLEVVYAALEGSGTVQAFRRTGEASFAPLGAPVHAGEAVCHIAAAPDGGSIVASCWGDGRVVRMTTDAAGRPSSPVTAAAANDPYAAGAVAAPVAGDIDLAAAARALREAAGAEYAHLVPDHDRAPAAEAPGGEAPARDAGAKDAGEDRSRPSHAHQALFLPGGLVATTDMGLDLVRFWRARPTGLAALQEVVLPKGSGPRHMVWHPSGHLHVVTELSHEVFVLAPDQAGVWRLVGGTQLGAGILADDTAAELAASRDGRFLYAGVRGSDTIAVVGVRGEGDDLRPVALVEAGVHWPRHHVVVRDSLLVAGQLSEDVASLGIDLRTGVPGRVRHRTPAPSPTCLLPAR